MKKFLILFTSVFCSFFLINKVNATVGGTTLVSGTDYTIEQVPIDELGATWQTVGTTLCYNCSYYPSYNFLINRNDYSKIAIGLSSNAPYVNIITFNNFTINNFALFSNSSVSQPKLILSEGNLPSFGGSCNTGSYCYNFINSGYQGNGYSATVHSNTIYIDSFGISPNGSLNMGYPYFKYFQCSNNGNCYVGTGSPSSQWGFSNQTVLNSVYFTTQTLTNGSYQPINQFLIEREQPVVLDPDATYVVSDGSEIGKKITFNFQNFDNDSYADITNLSTGDIIHLTDLKTNNSYVIDNISFDSVYYVEVYNNDSLVFVDTIDINEEVRLANKPYINLTLDRERLIAWLEFMNLKPDYHIYYSKNNGEFTEVFLEENKNSILVGFNNDQPELHNRNYTIHGKITDSNNNILYERGYNIVFFPDSPYFTFKSSYNSDSGCNQLTITYHNSLNSDIVSYSYDNTNYENFSNVKTNVLEVCYNSPIYVKATRGNDVYYGYYYVNVSEFSSSSNESFQQEYSLLTTFNNLFTGIDLSFLDNISSFFNALKSSYVFRFIMLCITGALILFIMRMIRR